jgi:hypothetical protein
VSAPATVSDRAPGDHRAYDAAWGHILIFAIGALSGLQVANFTLTLLSVVCLMLVPGYLLMRHRGADLLPLMLAAVGWISFLVSGVVNSVSPLWPNAVAPAAFSLYMIGLTVVTDRRVDRIVTVLAGIGVGTVVFFLTKGIPLTHTGNFLDLWKYGIAHAVTVVLLFALIKARVHPLVPAIVLAVLGLCSLGLNFRSHALVCLIAAATLFAHRILGTRVRRAWQFSGILVFGLGFGYLMPIAARAGIFGPALQRKTIEQQATELPTLLAGRTEPPMTLTAIMEHPIIGWGSAMRLTPDVYAQAEHLAVRMGFSPTFPFELYWRLPPTDYSAMHSIILGSWAEGGVLAVLLPLWLLVACIALVWNNTRYGRWAPIILTVSLQGIWDLLYAPWTYNTIAEYACIALLWSAAHFRGRTAGS